jgi:hypothetical protein
MIEIVLEKETVKKAFVISIFCIALPCFIICLVIHWAFINPNTFEAQIVQYVGILMWLAFFSIMLFVDYRVSQMNELFSNRIDSMFRESD